MTDIAKGVQGDCPGCGRQNLAYLAIVLESGDIVYRFSCAGCGESYRDKVSGPVATVEPLIGFSRGPYMWEPQP